MHLQARDEICDDHQGRGRDHHLDPRHALYLHDLPCLCGSNVQVILLFMGEIVKFLCRSGEKFQSVLLLQRLVTCLVELPALLGFLHI